MIYVYIILGIVVMAAMYDMGKAKAKKEWHGNVALQAEAMNGVYKIIAKTRWYAKTIVVAERHDGILQCLKLIVDPPSDIIKIEDGRVISFK